MTHKLQSISNKIIDAKLKFNRINDEIKLLAVSKTRTAAEIRTLYKLGQTAFGESYLQEATSKQQQLQDCAIEWHFIGPIQSNKTKIISQHFDWVQSLCRNKIAIKLNEHRLKEQADLNVLVQVNLNSEPSKQGLLPQELNEFCDFISQLPKLKFRGIMAIPQKSNNIEQQQDNFAKLHDLFISLKQKHNIDTLSMGMSSDYISAIKEGSTMVRIGTELFGVRNS